MGTKRTKVVVDFSKDLYGQLKAEAREVDLSEIRRPFPEWDILKELDRRAKRKTRDRGASVRQYMRDHPEEVERIKREHGLGEEGVR